MADSPSVAGISRPATLSIQRANYGVLNASFLPCAGRGHWWALTQAQLPRELERYLGPFAGLASLWVNLIWASIHLGIGSSFGSGIRARAALKPGGGTQQSA